MEYLHDHARTESLLSAGTLEPDGGRLLRDASRPGLGIELKRSDADEFRT